MNDQSLHNFINHLLYNESRIKDGSLNRKIMFSVEFVVLNLITLPCNLLSAIASGTTQQIVLSSP